MQEAVEQLGLQTGLIVTLMGVFFTLFSSVMGLFFWLFRRQSKELKEAQNLRIHDLEGRLAKLEVEHDELHSYIRIELATALHNSTDMNRLTIKVLIEVFRDKISPETLQNLTFSLERLANLAVSPAYTP